MNDYIRVLDTTAKLMITFDHSERDLDALAFMFAVLIEAGGPRTPDQVLQDLINRANALIETPHLHLQ
jgi:hypothetical protein